ncbi:MAG: NAD(+)/NADH kinase [Mycoplasmoidaceae bacterium]|nr:NAD(+)/NADH kinase [Mycoplasmoidaceae bacterium]
MNKKFFIYCNNSKKSQEAKKKLTAVLKKAGCKILPTAQNIIVLGGDGTFVHAYNTYCKKNVKMALINTGLVGFYSVNLKFDAKAIIKFFDNDKNFYKPDVVVCEANGKKYYAINEILIEGINTVSADILINNKHYEWF